MSRTLNILLTAAAPAVWGSTYIITTELLPEGVPLTSAALRALPAGLLLLLICRQLPTGHWWWKVLVLGALNFSIFWWLLFVAAYRLPGGIAATLGALQPLIVVFISFVILGTAIRLVAIVAALVGLAGVALLFLTPDVVFDPIGIAAGVGGALSMALGVVLTRKWQPPVSLLTFTAWQLIAGGILLVSVALAFEQSFPPLDFANIVGYVYLSLIGGAATYLLWFRGIVILGPNTVSSLGFLSPATAVILGWLLLGQSLSVLQMIGIAGVLGSILLAGRKPSS